MRTNPGGRSQIVSRARVFLRTILLAALLPALIAAAPAAHAKASKRPVGAKTTAGVKTSQVKATRAHRSPAVKSASRNIPHLISRAEAHSPAAMPGLRQAAHRTARADIPHKTLPPLVVIDAGHGGADSGAVGPAGTMEKTVTLATAQELGRQLRAGGRYRVVFTRDSDVFVPLPARVKVALTNQAALMVSIHADASTDRRARGASVYVRPAQSAGPDVARLPARGGNSRAIGRALAEPARPAAGSARLQLAMIESLNDDLSMVPDPARQGRFQVLGAVGIPSVLVETGFISNRKDEALLRQPRHRAVIARAIRDAVDSFFADRQRQTEPRT